MNAPTFQFYVPDFLASTADMSPEEVGIHIRLLCHQWMKGGIPNDVQRLMAMSGACQASSLEYVKSRYQLCEDGMLRHARMEEVRKEREEYIERQRINGGKRWKNRGELDAVAMPSLCQASAKPDAVAMPVDMPNACSPTPSPSPSPTPDSNSQPKTMSGTPTKSEPCGAAAPPCLKEVALPLVQASEPRRSLFSTAKAVDSGSSHATPPAPRVDRYEAAKEILVFLNAEAKREFASVPANLNLIRDRIREAEDDLDGIRTMIRRKVREWKGTDMEGYLRPATLFNKTKFRAYYDDRNQPIPTQGGPTNSGKPAQKMHPDGRPKSIPMQILREVEAEMGLVPGQY